ncbi:hypothetical protein IWW55_002057 [Coemansia sp. RSA 2706]|nr:hypothetical protein IWW55_002057 [Coemansia sp. RSA 2706]KAJ2315224.1 hypothetical protein IWW54_000444 [Coemansia sp. RSA 2705]KAJ2319494.1 hypothetical protein IWW52_001937 [Coemansia sp. RSA 2704]KAJ2327344.1 hypothetical protein IWW51_001803 [Coemansia sp. RSA 2702]KAJ2737465.1 hypothetical protein H4R23_001826 [Coemansia sp. Cherry 401B]
MTADICTTKPYFRFKRGVLTVFLETRATEKISAVKAHLVAALQAQGEDDAFAELDPARVELFAPQPDAEPQFRQLASNQKVSECGVNDCGEIFFVLQNDDGTWEEPCVADYDADAQEMDTGY